MAPERRVRPKKPPRVREPEIALRLRSDGIEETIPLTREILLNPSLDIQVPQSRSHNDKLRSLDHRLFSFLRARGLTVYSDVILNWPGVRNVSPDLSVIEGLREGKAKKGELDSVDVAAEGCRVRAVFEVVSSGKLARWKDETKNPPYFAQRGVDDLVHFYLPKARQPGDPPLRVFSNPTAAGYTEQMPDPEGFFLLRSIGVRIGVESMSGGGEKIVLLDAKTGQTLPDVEEATRRAEHETEARREAEQLNQELTAEIERLRAQLRDRD